MGTHELPGPVGLISTYPPTRCGLATFAAALARALVRRGAAVHVVPLLDGRPAPPGSGPAAPAGPAVALPDAGGASAEPALTPDGRAMTPRDVAAPWDPVAARRSVAEALAGCEAVLLQHEYGIYAGEDGEEILALLAALPVPIIATLHTVLAHPTPHQRWVLQGICRAAERVVVMSATARHRLVEQRIADPRRVVIIPHGVADTAAGRAPLPEREGPTTILTWGLLGPGKGIELALEAVAGLPGVRYVVAGEIHPNVRQRSGEAYRDGLLARAEALGIRDRVVFQNRYLDPPALRQLIADAHVVLLPYESREQVTSGVLVDALAAGRPVVATAFPHAVELLASGAGLVVPHGDAEAMTVALKRVLLDPEEARRMATTALRVTADHHWPVVAARYLDLVRGVAAARPTPGTLHAPARGPGVTPPGARLPLAHVSGPRP